VGDKNARTKATEKVIADIREFHETKPFEMGVFVLVIPDALASAAAAVTDKECEVEIPDEKIPGTNDRPVKLCGKFRATIKVVLLMQALIDDHAQKTNMKAEDYEVPGYKAKRA
jgi:hypothetical protein